MQFVASGPFAGKRAIATMAMCTKALTAIRRCGRHTCKAQLVEAVAAVRGFDAVDVGDHRDQSS